MIQNLGTSDIGSVGYPHVKTSAHTHSHSILPLEGPHSPVATVSELANLVGSVTWYKIWASSCFPYFPQ